MLKNWVFSGCSFFDLYVSTLHIVNLLTKCMWRTHTTYYSQQGREHLEEHWECKGRSCKTNPWELFMSFQVMTSGANPAKERKHVGSARVQLLQQNNAEGCISTAKHLNTPPHAGKSRYSWVQRSTRNASNGKASYRHAGANGKPKHVRDLGSLRDCNTEHHIG